jgi:hypothetical protein
VLRPLFQVAQGSADRVERNGGDLHCPFLRSRARLSREEVGLGRSGSSSTWK